MIWVESSWLWHISWFKMWLAWTQWKQNSHYLEAMYIQRWIVCYHVNNHEKQATLVIFKIKATRNFYSMEFEALCLKVICPLHFHYRWLWITFHEPWHNYVKKKYKTKRCAMLLHSACQIGREEKELLCRFALLLHSSSFNWKTSSIMLCMTIFLCHFLPAHHNIITFHFSSQGPIFSFIQDNSCEAQPWCLLRWWNVFGFCFSLTNSNFHTPAWQIFLLQKREKKMHSALKLS